MIPEEFRPQSIFHETQTVIVIGFPMTLPIVETAPSIFYHELYRTINALLDTSGYQISSFLDKNGFPSIWLPRDGHGSISKLRKNPSHASLIVMLHFLPVGAILVKTISSDQKIWAESPLYFSFYCSENSIISVGKAFMHVLFILREWMSGESPWWQGVSERIDH